MLLLLLLLFCLCTGKKATNCWSTRRQLLGASGPTVQQRWVIRKQKPVGRTLWLEAASIRAWEREAAVPTRVSYLRPDRTAVSLSSDCACCFQTTGLLLEIWAQLLLRVSLAFAPFPGFSESSGGRLLKWWGNFPGRGREMSAPAWTPERPTEEREQKMIQDRSRHVFTEVRHRELGNVK